MVHDPAMSATSEGAIVSVCRSDSADGVTGVASAKVECRGKGASLTGRQTQTWIRTDDGGVFAAAQVSLMPLPRA